MDLERKDAFNIAGRVIVAAMQTDNLPWPANMAKNKRIDMLRGYINELTDQFMEDQNGQEEGREPAGEAG